MNAESSEPVARGWLRAAGLVGGVGVALGAFAAHGLRDRLAPSALEIFRTGVLYHLVHAVALLALALAGARGAGARVARLCFLAGVLVFSGSLYALALTGRGLFGAITPVGGLLFLVGWAALFVGGARPRP